MLILALTPDTERLRPVLEEVGAERVVLESRMDRAWVRLRERRWPLVLVDTEFGDGVALDLIEQVGSRAARLAVIARSVSMTLAAEVLERGACDLLANPPDPGKVRQLLAEAKAVDAAEEHIAAVPSMATIIGQSPGMLAAFKAAARVAKSPATVLIRGESGTGKELLARDIHQSSNWADGPFVPVNCAAIPENLVESELFGHEKGAFTGAAARRIGRFQRASGGTLFLDEVGDMSLTMQAKILRALQEGEIERVGGDTAIPVNIRVVAATNRNLLADVAAGRFREDLYYRLAVAVIHLPPLRERGDDIRLLASHLVAQFANECGRVVRAISPDCMALLRAYSWPGNVRQLRNAIQRAVLVADGEVLLPRHLPPELQEPSLNAATDGRASGTLIPLRELERRHIQQALELTGGHLARTAELLGIHRNTLRRKLRDQES